jgi:hypothetical protein
VKERHNAWPIMEHCRSTCEKTVTMMMIIIDPRFCSRWSVPAPKSGLTISSLVFQGFFFLLDGTAKPVHLFHRLPSFLYAAANYFHNFVFLYTEFKYNTLQVTCGILHHYTVLQPSRQRLQILAAKTSGLAHDTCRQTTPCTCL